MIPVAVVTGLGAAVVLAASAGAPAGALPGIALGSEALLLAERVVALFAIWMFIAMAVIRAFRHELPVEISNSGVRYAEAEDVEAKAVSTRTALREVEAEVRWMRRVVLELKDESDQLGRSRDAR